MSNSLGLDSQNLLLLVNFTPEILDSFKPKPHLSRCKSIKAQSLHDSLLKPPSFCKAAAVASTLRE